MIGQEFHLISIFGGQNPIYNKMSSRQDKKTDYLANISAVNEASTKYVQFIDAISKTRFCEWFNGENSVNSFHEYIKYQLDIKVVKQPYVLYQIFIGYQLTDIIPLNIKNREEILSILKEKEELNKCKRLKNDDIIKTLAGDDKRMTVLFVP